MIPFQFKRERVYMGAGVLSAALLVLSFPPYSAFGLSFIGLVPLFLALFSAQTIKQAFILGHTCAIAFILFGLNWVNHAAINYGELPWIIGQLVLILFSLFAELQFVFLALVFYFLKKNYNQSKWRAALFFLALPAAYTGFDFLYPKIFPTTLGQCLYHWFTLAQTAEYWGVYGLTFTIVLSNLCIALCIQSWRSSRKLDCAATIGVILVALSIAGMHFWGKARIEQLQALEKSFTDSLKVSMIQGNIGDIEKVAAEKGFQPAVQHVFNTYRTMSLQTVMRFQPELIIWPETAYPFLYTHGQDSGANATGDARDKWISQVFAELKTSLYFGGYSSLNKKEFNSAFLLSPPFELAGLYRKSILLAFGEYIPLGPLAPLIQEIVPMIADFGRGQGPTVFELKRPSKRSVKFGPQICYEGIVQEFSREEVKKGADFLLNITNDSWFGKTTEPLLHLLLTTFRSIELRRPMLRSTNTGYTLLIDITGKQQYRTRLFEPEIVELTLSLPGQGQSFPETFYLRYGEIFAKLCVAIGFLGLVLAFFFRKSRQKFQ